MSAQYLVELTEKNMLLKCLIFLFDNQQFDAYDMLKKEFKVILEKGEKWLNTLCRCK